MVKVKYLMGMVLSVALISCGGGQETGLLKRT